MDSTYADMRSVTEETYPDAVCLEESYSITGRGHGRDASECR